MDFKQALRFAVKGKSTCFLGAGFSYHAKNAEKTRFPIAEGLSVSLGEELTDYEDGNLKEISQDYIDEHGKEKLYRKIRNLFSVVETEEDYSPFSLINWKSIYTTNYDNLVEWSLRKLNKPVNSFTIQDTPTLRILSEQNCIHINGFVDAMSLQGFDSEFRLTETSYLSKIFNESPWKTAFNIDLRESQSVFFVGYSLYDLEIESVLLESEYLKEKTFFILEESPKPRLVKKLSKYGTVINIGIKGFLDELKQAQIDWKDEDEEFEFSSLRRISAQMAEENYGTDELISLLMEGEIQQSIIKSEILNKSLKYYVFRKEITDLAFDFRDNDCIIIHSKLANGKTLFMHGAAEHLDSIGYTCFEFIEGQTLSTSEIEALKKERRPVLFIENYHRCLDAIKTITTVAADSIKLVLTSRTELHEIFIENIENMLSSYHELDINNLKSQDVDLVIKLLEENGLFGELAAENTYKKKKIITTTLRSEFSQILGDIFKAPQIKKRISILLDGIDKNTDFKEVIILTCIASILSFELDDLDINTISGAVRFGKIRHLKDEELSQLIEKEKNGSIIIKNPVLAKIVLEHISNSTPDILKSYLIGFYEKLNRNIDLDSKYESILKDLNVYSNLCKIFGNKGGSQIDDFYDTIKVHFRNSKHPHFWLQWAIAKLSIKQYDKAETFFNTAYSLAGAKRKYNHDWVNCQYARLLIETAPDLIHGEQMIERIEKAHSLLEGQDNRHYPYRAAIQYFDFYDQVHKVLSDKQKIRFKELATHFYEKLPHVLKTMKNEDHPVLNNYRARYKSYLSKL